MIPDPTILCQCDNCPETQEITPEYMYRTMSERSGFYDCEDSAIEEKLTRLGWHCEGGDNGRHLCPGCAPKPAEEDWE